MKQTVLSNLLKEINNYIDQGNDAIKRGSEDESINWYRKGLLLAIQLKNKPKEDEITGLLITMI